MGNTMSVHEYTLALTETRAAQSQIIAAERDAAQKALAKAKTAQGKVELNRRAQSHVAGLLRTAKEAERIAKLEVLKSASIEPESVGRERLIAATAELFAIRPDQVKHHRDKPAPRKARPVKTIAEGPKRGRGRPRAAKHGLSMYRSGACKCDEVCRPANAARQQERRQARAAAKQP